MLSRNLNSSHRNLNKKNNGVVEHKGMTLSDSEIEEILSGEFDLDVVNFTKHNPKKTPTWWHLKNDWFIDPKFHGVPESTQLLYIKLGCLRAASGERLVSVTTAWIQRRVGVRSSSCKRGLVTLCKKGLISLDKIRIDKIREEEEEYLALNSKTAIKKHSAITQKSASSSAEELLTPAGISLFKKRLGSRYEKEIQAAYVHWESIGKAKGTPFQVVLNRWCQVLEKNPDAGSKEINWDEVCK